MFVQKKILACVVDPSNIVAIAPCAAGENLTTQTVWVSDSDPSLPPADLDFSVAVFFFGIVVIAHLANMFMGFVLTTFKR